METSLRCVWQEAPHPWWSGITSSKTVRHRTAETNSCVVVCVQDKWDQACDVCRSLCGWGMSGYSCSLLAEKLFSRGTAFSRLMFFTWAEFSLNLVLCRAVPEVTLMLQEHASHCAPWSILPAAGQRCGVTAPSLQSRSYVDADIANKAGLRSLTFCCAKATGQEKNQVSQCLSASGCCRWGKSGQRYLGKPCPCNEMWAESFLAGLIFPLLIFHRWRMSVCERTANTARTGYTLLAITHLSSLLKEEKTRNLAGSRLLG